MLLTYNIVTIYNYISFAGPIYLEDYMPLELTTVTAEAIDASDDDDDDDDNDGDNLIISDNEVVGDTVEIEIAAESVAEDPVEQDKTEDKETYEAEDLPESGEGWRCSACSTTFPSPLGLEVHACIAESPTAAGRRTRNKRKGNPVKIASPLKKPKEESATNDAAKRKRGRPRKNLLPIEIDVPPQAVADLARSNNVEQPLKEVVAVVTQEDVMPPMEAEPDTSPIQEAPVVQVIEEVTPELPDNGTVITRLPPEMIVPPAEPVVETAPRKLGRKSKVVRKKLREPRTLFSCTTCNKAFSTQSKLRTHSFAHTGEKPFA